MAQHLRAWAAYSEGTPKLFSWRTRGGSEIDFVVYGEAGFWGFEVKDSRTAHRSHLRALRAFLDDYSEAQAALLYRGTDRLLVDDVLCVPVDEFLRGVVRIVLCSRESRVDDPLPREGQGRRAGLPPPKGHGLSQSRQVRS